MGDYSYLCSVATAMKEIFLWRSKHTAPIILTIVWCIGLFFVLKDEFDIILSVHEPAQNPIDQNIHLNFFITIGLFFVECAIIMYEYHRQFKAKNQDTTLITYLIIVFILIAITLSLVIFHSLPLVILISALLCVAVVKLLSCQLSNNPTHFHKKQKRKDTQEKGSLIEINVSPKQTKKPKSAEMAETENKPNDKTISDLPFNDPSDDPGTFTK